jgi:hypothetical protein
MSLIMIFNQTAASGIRYFDILTSPALACSKILKASQKSPDYELDGSLTNLHKYWTVSSLEIHYLNWWPTYQAIPRPSLGEMPRYEWGYGLIPKELWYIAWEDSESAWQFQPPWRILCLIWVLITLLHYAPVCTSHKVCHKSPNYARQP